MTRDTILAAVGAATSKSPPSRAALRMIRPAAIKSTHGIVAQFKAALENRSAIVLDVPDLQNAPAAIARALIDAGTPLTIRTGANGHLSTLDWTASRITHLQGRADPSDTTCVSAASAGIAETGTLLLVSGPENPSTLALLPETHIVVIEAAAIVQRMEDAFATLTANSAPGFPNTTSMPRSLMLISGPSRTGDIGGRIVLGAHGPRRLCVVIVG